jgi:hypothetical protein
MLSTKWTPDKVKHLAGVSVVNGSFGKNKAVMNLTDGNFRKTFTHNFHTSDMQAQYVLTKRGLFDNYKYRRLLLGEQ